MGSDNGVELFVCAADSRLLWSSMGNPVPFSGAPAAMGWDMAFTRLSNAVQERVMALVQDLTSRWHAAGARSSDGPSAFETVPDRILAWTHVGLCSTAIHVLAMGHFGPVAAAPNCA